MASALDARLARMARRDQARLASLATATGTRLADLFAALPGLDDPDLRAWLRQATPAVLAAQDNAVRSAFAFGTTYATLARTSLGPLPRTAAVIEAIRPGVSAADVYARPVVTARWALSAGHPIEAAMRMGANKAAALARTDVSEAGRAGAAEARGATKGCTGFVRVAAPGACDYCALIATSTFPVREVAPAHANCSCGEAPVIGRVDPGAVTREDARAGLGMTEDAAADALAAMPTVPTETGPSTP